jgi:uncharacterized C2H2 Zn-finger protein
MSTDPSPNVSDIASRDVEPFRCETCGIPFTTGEELRRHIQLTHKGGQIGANEKPSAPRTRIKKRKTVSVRSAEAKATKTKLKTRRKVGPTKKSRTRTRSK